MKKFLVLPALAAVSAATVALAQAGTGPASARPFADPGGPYEFAVGGAERSADVFAARHVAFSAHNGPRGASGEFTSRSATLSFTGEVTCLRVDGNRAVIGGIIRHSSSPDLEGTTYFAAVEDNGNPSDATPDRVGAFLLGGV